MDDTAPQSSRPLLSEDLPPHDLPVEARHTLSLAAAKQALFPDLHFNLQEAQAYLESEKERLKDGYEYAVREYNHSDPFDRRCLERPREPWRHAQARVDEKRKALRAALNDLIATGTLVIWARENDALGPWIRIPHDSWLKLWATDSEDVFQKPATKLYLFAIRFGWTDAQLERPMASGMPGRPTMKSKIQGELRRRMEAGESANTVTEEAHRLHIWCKQTYPTQTSPSEKTIRNQISEEFRKRRKLASP